MTNLSSLKSVSGLYIVELKNEQPISVNANDKRLAHKCIKVNNLNCKFGKAKCLQTRKANYIKTFGEENIIYMPIVTLTEIDIAEKLILKELEKYRIKGPTGRSNEWLANIGAHQLMSIIFSTLSGSQISFTVLNY